MKRGGRSFKCMSLDVDGNGCEGWAAFWITKDGYNKHVCNSCKQEMTSVFGWEILDWNDTLLQRGSDG